MTRINEQGSSADKGRYLGFLKLAAGILAALLTLGYLPTVRLAGEKGIWAMLAGCGVSLVGSVAGTMPLLLSRSRNAVEVMPAVIGSIALRLTVVVALAAATAWVGWFANKPFLLWVAISHLGLLVADTRYARAEVQAKPESKIGAIKDGAGA